MKGSLHIIIYSLAMGLICSSLLTAAFVFTEPYVKANEEAAKQRNVFKVLGIDFDPEASHQVLQDIFDENVHEDTLGELTRYSYLDKADAKGNRETLAVAIGFNGPGMWKPIYGFLALDSSMTTIQGITFYKQEETPGLGGEIVKDFFTERFIGKRIFIEGEDGEKDIIGIRLLRGGATADNEVDAITGATGTCKKVEEMLNKTIAEIVANRQAAGQPEEGDNE